LQVVVSLGEPKRQLGIAYPTSGSTGTIAVRNVPNGRQFDIGIGFQLHFSKPALEEVEAYRNGGDTTFHLALHGELKGYQADGAEPRMTAPGDPWSAHVLIDAAPSRVYRQHPGLHSLILKVPQSDWIKLLERAGYQRSILFEVSVPDATTIGKAVVQLKEAQDAFYQGRYADVVSRCRDALDGVIPLRQIGQRQLFKAASEEDARRGMTIEDAFCLAWASIRQIMNTSHHRNGVQIAFTRPMAQFVLGATALALDTAGKERSVFMRLQEPVEPYSA
jgi:hypothetical protein